MITHNDRAPEAPQVIAMPKIDPALPKASMKIRLATGKAVNVEFNLGTKIDELYKYVSEYYFIRVYLTIEYLHKRKDSCWL